MHRINKKLVIINTLSPPFEENRAKMIVVFIIICTDFQPKARNSVLLCNTEFKSSILSISHLISDSERYTVGGKAVNALGSSVRFFNRYSPFFGLAAVGVDFRATGTVAKNKQLPNSNCLYSNFLCSISLF